MNTRLACIAIALLSLPSLGICAQPTPSVSTLAPIADAYVQDGKKADKNFCTDKTLQVATSAKAGDNLDSYLKFDLTTVPAFAQAKLRLLASLSAKGSLSTTVYAVPVTTWVEKTITWNNKPARGVVVGAFTVASKTAALVDIDVTGYLLSERAQGRNVVTLALHSVANTTVTLKMNSREAKTDKPLLVFAPDKAPVVAISAPAANALFAAPATINVAANVADTDGTIAKVDFFQGTMLIGTATTAPYSINGSNVAAGSYSLTAKATDNSGVTATSAPVSIVVDALPTVSLTAPADQSSFHAPASFNVTASASDSDGSIAKVEFYQNGSLLQSVITAPYSIPVNQSVAGTYTYTAKAFDNKGLSAQSGSVSVTVLSDVAPTITLSANGSRFRTPATITLSANASDADGSIAQVDFYQGATLIGSTTTTPYTVTVNQASADTLTFYAKATDNAGLTAQSNSVTVVVSSTPAVYYIHADQIDTPRVVTDQANKVVWRWDGADPFGAGRPDEDPDGDGSRFTMNLRFPGQYFDRETGLHYNYFRDYDPGTGRYIESDPIGLDGGINTYAYVESNPTAFSDPTGLVKHTTGRTIDCGKGCWIRIDYTFDEKTGVKTRHLHWGCKGKEGECGEFGAQSHGGTWDDAPAAIQECATKHGFQGGPAPASESNSAPQKSTDPFSGSNTQSPRPPAAPSWAPLLLPLIIILFSQ
jgi:RHS repeat-associated protein